MEGALETTPTEKLRELSDKIGAEIDEIILEADEIVSSGTALDSEETYQTALAERLAAVKALYEQMLTVEVEGGREVKPFNSTDRSGHSWANFHAEKINIASSRLQAAYIAVGASVAYRAFYQSEGA